MPNQISVASLPPDAHGDVSIAFGLSGSGVRPTIGISRPGVYPVEVQLVNTGVASGSFVTWLVVVDTSAPETDREEALGRVRRSRPSPIRSPLPDGSDDPKVVARDEAAAAGSTRSRRSSPRTSGLPDVARARPRDRRGVEAARAARPGDQGVVRVACAPPRCDRRPRSCRRRTFRSTRPRSRRPGSGDYLTGRVRQRARRALRSALGVESRRRPRSPRSSIPRRRATRSSTSFRQMLIDRVAVRDQALIPVDHPFSPAEAFVLDTAGGGYARRRDGAVRRGSVQRARSERAACRTRRRRARRDRVRDAVDRPRRSSSHRPRAGSPT